MGIKAGRLNVAARPGGDDSAESIDSMTTYGFGSSKARWDSQTLSFTLWRFAGIRIRLHLLFLIFFAFDLLRNIRDVGMLWAIAVGLPFSLMFALFVLLHEFGHCFGCRSVGGTADDVLLWPLGGLAYCDAPPMPLENLVTTLCGPCVNLVALVLLAPLVAYCGAFDGSLFDPFSGPFVQQGVALYAVMAWKVNYWLLLFNMCLPIYPFDFGRIIQQLLWFKHGYVRATMIATTVGIAGAVILAAVSLFAAGRWPNLSVGFFLLTSIAIFGLFECVRVRKELELSVGQTVSETDYDFSEGYLSLERSARRTRSRKGSPSLLQRYRQWLDQRRQKKRESLEDELDRILEKIATQGMDSLTRAERRILQEASRRRRHDG